MHTPPPSAPFARPLRGVPKGSPDPPRPKHAPTGMTAAWTLPAATMRRNFADTAPCLFIAPDRFAPDLCIVRPRRPPGTLGRCQRTPRTAANKLASQGFRKLFRMAPMNSSSLPRSGPCATSSDRCALSPSSCFDRLRYLRCRFEISANIDRLPYTGAVLQATRFLQHTPQQQCQSLAPVRALQRLPLCRRDSALVHLINAWPCHGATFGFHRPLPCQTKLQQS